LHLKDKEKATAKSTEAPEHGRTEAQMRRSREVQKQQQKRYMSTHKAVGR
jgi:hypothetical protein